MESNAPGLVKKMKSYLEEIYEGKTVSWEEHRSVNETRDTNGKVIKLIPSDTTVLTITIKS